MGSASQHGTPEAQLRRLQNTAEAAEVAVVNTAAELWDAVAAGAPHIEIRSHLDITELSDPTAEKHATLPVANLRFVQSIRGACAEPWPEEVLQRVPEQPPLLSRLPGQCLVVTNGTLLRHIGELWLHNLYLRNVYDRLDSGTLLIRSAPSDLAPMPSSLYMTAVTSQGDGNNTAFLYVEQMAYAQGCTFSDGGGVPQVGFKGAPPVLVDGTASFVDCMFRRTSGVFVGAQSNKSHVIEARDSSTAVRLQRTAFTDNPVDTQLLRVNSSSSIFADDLSLTVWDSAFNATVATEPLSSVPSRPLFLRADDAWFVDTQRRVLGVPPPDGGGGGSRGYVGASAAVMAALALAVVALALFIWHRRRRDRLHLSLSNNEVATTDDAHEPSGRGESFSAPRHHFRISADPDGSHKIMDANNHQNGPQSRPNRDPSGKSESVLVTTIESSASICSTNPAASLTSPPLAVAGSSSASNATPPTAADMAKSSKTSSATLSNPTNAVSATSSGAANGMEICAGNAPGSIAPSSGGDTSAAAPSTHAVVAPHTAPLHLPPPLSFLSLSSAALVGAGPESGGERPAPLSGFPMLQKFSSVATCQSTTQMSVEDAAPPPPPPPPPPLPQHRPPPPQGASVAQRMDYAQYQLDTLDGLEVLDGLVLNSGHSNRLHGGQAVIQFAKDKETHEEFAIKVFVSRRAFEDEARLYEADSCPLGQFLPQVRDIVPNRDARLVDAGGTPLPPCIVMEKGESLDVWMLRCADMGIDMVTGLQVVTHISQRLLDLHSAGYVHRDLKPSNIMWLPRGNRWTLIDFGCAARAGAVAPLSFSLAYAAPEVIEASQAGAKTIEVTAAMDAWALGMVAVELFSNDVAINLIEGSAMVRKRISGELPLPWEDPEKSPALFRSLGRFKGAVMALLRRDASQRISVADFVRQARRVLTHTTNTTNEVP